MVNQPGDARRRTQARRADRGLLCADGLRLASNCATKGGRERDTGARITRPSKGNVARQTTSPRRLRFDTSSTRAQRAAYNRIRLDRQPPATPAATTRAQNSRNMRRSSGHQAETDTTGADLPPSEQPPRPIHRPKSAETRSHPFGSTVARGTSVSRSEVVVRGVRRTCVGSLPRG